MPITMHENLRPQNRYRFLNGEIVKITNDAVTIQPFGSDEHVDAFFDQQVTYFWKGGHNFTKTLVGAVGDQDTIEQRGRFVIWIGCTRSVRLLGAVVSIQSWAGHIGRRRNSQSGPSRDL